MPTDTGHGPKFDRSGQGSRLHDTKKLRVSLKQWRMLHAVIDHGGYAGAAASLNLSQSAISYTVAKLQEQVGVALLKIDGRKAQLTKEGAELLQRSRPLLKAALELEAFAADLRKGWEPELQLAVVETFPPDLLMTALRRFAQAIPNCNVSIRQISSFDLEKTLRVQSADLIVGDHMPHGASAKPLAKIDYTIVAHRNHPLCKLGRNVTTEDLDNEIEVSICGADKFHDSEVADGLSVVRRWKVTSFDLACAAVQGCVGYAWLPLRRVKPFLNTNEWQIVPVRGERCSTENMYLIEGRRLSASSAAAKLSQALHEVVAADVDRYDFRYETA